eukprot:jgi/Antlo1/1560/920
MQCMLLFLGLGLAFSPEEQMILASTLNESIEESLRNGKLLSEFGVPRFSSARKQGNHD